MGNNKRHILIVDDDNRIRDLLKEYLKFLVQLESYLVTVLYFFVVLFSSLRKGIY